MSEHASHDLGSQDALRCADGVVAEFLAQLDQGRICLHSAGTICGLTFDPRNDGAWRRLYGLKKRSNSKKLLFLVHCAEKAMAYWQPLPAGWEEVLRRLWPAHVSVVWQSDLHAMREFPEHVCAWTSMGFRVPYYESGSWFEEVLRKFPYPLPTTSVNVGGTQHLVLEEEMKSFAQKHNIYCPPRLFSGKQEAHEINEPSAVVRILKSKRYKVLRSGCYSRGEIDALLALEQTS